jgi:hypothetical protein
MKIYMEKREFSQAFLEDWKLGEFNPGYWKLVCVSKMKKLGKKLGIIMYKYQLRLENR